MITKIPFFSFFRKSEWREAQEFICKMNEEREQDKEVVKDGK